jgi:hypothetical protein
VGRWECTFLPVKGRKFDAPNVLRPYQLHPDFIRVIGRSFLTYPDDFNPRCLPHDRVMEGHFGAQTQDAFGGDLSAEPVDNDGPGLLCEFNAIGVFSAQPDGYLDRKRGDGAASNTL